MSSIIHQSNDLQRLVAVTRRRLRRNAVVTGLMIAVAAALGWLVAAALVDLLAPLPVSLRLVGAVGLCAIAAVTVLAGVLWPAVQPLKLNRVAYRIERTVPKMHNRLITVLDLRSRPVAEAEDPFVEKLIEQTRARLANYQTRDVANPKSLRLSTLSAMAVLLAAVALVMTLGEPMTVALMRIVQPTAPIAPVSYAKVIALSGDMRVLEGETAWVRGAVEHGHVGRMYCRLRPLDGRWTSYPMKGDVRAGFTFPINEVTQSYEYEIRAARTWTARHRITVVRRPVVEEVAAAVRLPDYMALPRPRPVKDLAEQISAPMGSSVELSVKIRGDAVRGEIELYKPQMVQVWDYDEKEQVWFDDDFPADARITGKPRWVSDRQYSGTRAHRFDWSGKPYAFVTRQHKFEIQPDEALFMYVWLDPDEPPQKLTLTVTAEGEKHALVWGEPAAASQWRAGELPEPGQWVRLEVPLWRLPRKLGDGKAAPNPPPVAQRLAQSKAAVPALAVAVEQAKAALVKAEAAAKPARVQRGKLLKIIAQSTQTVEAAKKKLAQADGAAVKAIAEHAAATAQRDAKKAESVKLVKQAEDVAHEHEEAVIAHKKTQQNVASKQKLFDVRDEAQADAKAAHDKDKEDKALADASAKAADEAKSADEALATAKNEEAAAAKLVEKYAALVAAASAKVKEADAAVEQAQAEVAKRETVIKTANQAQDAARKPHEQAVAAAVEVARVNKPLVSKNDETIEQAAKARQAADRAQADLVATREAIAEFEVEPMDGLLTMRDRNMLRKQVPVARLTGIQFEVDQGRAFFDRAGALKQTFRSVQRRQMILTGARAMAKDDSPYQWNGSVPVDGDHFFTVRFYNAAVDPSPPVQMMSLLATSDELPTVLIEKPGKSVTLAQPQPVPLMVRAFDDYGVRSVAIQTGDSEQALGEPNELAAYDQPRSSELVLWALDPKRHEMVPGADLYYRLAVTDFKGQTAHSETLRLSLAADEGSADADADHARKPFDALLDDIAPLLDMQGEVSGDMAELLANLLPEAQVSSDSLQGLIKLLNPDGTPMTSQQIQESLDARWEQLTEQQQQEVQTLNQRLAEQQQKLIELQQKLAAAAAGAQESPTALAEEAALLAAMAERAGAMAAMLKQDQPAEVQMLSMVGLPQMMPSLLDTTRDLERQLEELSRARQMLEASPAEAQQQMAALMSLSQTRDSLDVMGGLQRALEDRQQQIGEVQQQLEALQQQAHDAPTDQLDEISQQQQALDAMALEQMRQNLSLLENLPDEQMELQSPWAPPGQRTEGLPVEQDTPEEKPEPDEERVDDRPAPDAEAQDEPADWWDQPVEVDQPQVTRQMGERFEGRQRAVAPPAPHEAQGPATPRQMLEQHQQQMGQQLTQNSNDLRTTSNRVQQAMDQAQSLSSQLQAQTDRSRADQDGRDAAEPPPGNRSQQLMDSVSQWQQMMNSPRMQQMMDMASHAAAMPMTGADQTNNSWLLPFSLNTPDRLRRGMVLYMEMEDLPLSATQQARMYRLPPRLRQPLLQGMNERGPEGYQRLIDAYYRQLGQEVE